jgi:single-strand DNA-binding protein
MVNKVILVGNVGGEPEVRTTESGVKVARIRLATSERYTDRQSGERKELTEWHTITLWRGLADIVDRYVHKGSQLFIEGRLRTREWTDKDNIKRYPTEILADDMKLLGRRSDNQSAPGAMPAAQPYQQPAQPSGYSQPYQQPAAAPSYAQPSYQQPAQPQSIPAPQEDPDDLPF